MCQVRIIHYATFNFKPRKFYFEFCVYLQYSLLAVNEMFLSPPPSFLYTQAFLHTTLGNLESTLPYQNLSFHSNVHCMLH